MYIYKILNLTLVPFYSIAMATKENLGSQKTALKMITQKMNSLASILYWKNNNC